MKELVAKFPEQLREAMKIGASAKLLRPGKISNVLISGLGGSGIGGTIVSEITARDARVPVCVTKGYFIPGFVNRNTLVIISSYSGNTEETLNCLQLALKKKARVVCITSGGKVAEIARKKKLDLILIPGGNPPRACLGYSMTQLFYVLSHYKIISSKYLLQLKASVGLLEEKSASIQSAASGIAEGLKGKTPIVYATTYFEGVAIRFRQQLNENAKILCGHHVIPEMNHNELVGWPSGTERVAVILLRDRQEYARNNARIEINKEVITRHTPHVTEVWSEGRTPLEKALYFIHLVDWVSVRLAELRGVDAMEVRVIDMLKGKLAEVR